MSSAADYYGGSAVPPTAAYGPPKVDFSALTGGLDTFVKGRQEGREEDTATAFRNGIPMVKDAINIKTFIGETPLSGIEYGFFSRIAQIAYCGSMN